MAQAEEALAAHRAGLTDVILPERNRGDLDDVPDEVREAMAVSVLRYQADRGKERY